MVSNFELFKAIAQGQRKTRRKPGHQEHDIQVACVRWFRLQYPQLSHALFSVPNGGRRDEKTGAMIKAEGALPGVSDLILLHPGSGFWALLIEMKTATGTQSTKQIEWQQAITASGNYKYIVCRSLEDFMKGVKQYLE